MRGDVRVQVVRTLDLVDELGGDGIGGDGAAVPGVLGDHRGAVLGQFGDREPGRGHARDVGETGEVAAGGVRPALDDVPGDHSRGQPVPVAGSPAVPPGGRPGGQRRVGDPPADDDVGAGTEGRRYPPPAEVGVCGDRPARPVRQRSAGVGAAQLVPRRPQLRQPGQQVVAVDVRHPQPRARVRRRGADFAGQPGGVEPARVDDQLAPAGGQVGPVRAQLVQEVRHVAAGRVAAVLARERRQGELGQVVPDEHVHRIPGQHLVQRAAPIPEVSGELRDPHRGHGTHLLAFQPAKPSSRTDSQACWAWRSSVSARAPAS